MWRRPPADGNRRLLLSGREEEDGRDARRDGVRPEPCDAPRHGVDFLYRRGQQHKLTESANVNTSESESKLT